MMSVQFLTNISEQEFKELLKDALRDLLKNELGALKNQPSVILDLQQTAEFLKLKVNTLYEKTSKKQIPHFKKGNKLYFHRSALEKWISEGKVRTYEELESQALAFTLNRKAA